MPGAPVPARRQQQALSNRGQGSNLVSSVLSNNGLSAGVKGGLRGSNRITGSNANINEVRNRLRGSKGSLRGSSSGVGSIALGGSSYNLGNRERYTSLNRGGRQAGGFVSLNSGRGGREEGGRRREEVVLYRGGGGTRGGGSRGEGWRGGVWTSLGG